MDEHSESFRNKKSSKKRQIKKMSNAFYLSQDQGGAPEPQ